MPKKDPSQTGNPRKSRTILLAAGLFLIGSLLTWGIIRNLGALLVKSTPFPIDMHSSTQADYSADPEFYQFPPMDIQLVIDAIWDENLDAIHLGARLTQVNENFIASVSSVTPMPAPSDTSASNINTAEGTQTLTTITPETPLYTPTQTPPGFVPSQTPTQDLVSPTDTPQLPTDTIIPPTNTTAPPTNTVSPCGQLALSGFGTDVKKVKWNLVNNSTSLVTISSISLNWPEANSSLDKIFLGTGKIWDGDAAPPSATINSGWTAASRNINGNTTLRIEFTFIETTAPTGYNLGINFTNGCSINKSN